MLNSMPAAKAGVETQDIGDETLLLDGDDIHVLNETATFIWRLCDGQHSPAEIEAALREEYAIPPDYDATADIAQTISELQAKGLLETT